MPEPNTVTVQLDIDKNGQPHFTFKPPELVLTDTAKVVWKRSASGKKFTFAALAFYEKNPFKDVVVHEKENEITAVDDYEVAQRHHYGVLVKVESAGATTYYNSNDEIHVGTGGDPTIRNK